MKVVPPPAGERHVDAAAGLHDDPVDGREPEPGSNAVLLRREERLEDVRQNLCGDPGTGVRDGEHDVAFREGAAGEMPPHAPVSSACRPRRG